MTSTPLSGDTTFEPLSRAPALAPLAAELFWCAQAAAEPAAFLTAVLPLLLSATGADFAAPVSTDSGQWTPLARLGPARPLPVGLLADVLDRENGGGRRRLGGRSAGPPRHDRRAAVVARRLGPAQRRFAPLDRSHGGDRGACLIRVRRAQHQHARIHRLEAILEIASQWNKTSEMEPLLKQMAEAATRLLLADRASIFLWDRPNHMLVGRPALGSPVGELRIPDNLGGRRPGDPNRCCRGGPAPTRPTAKSIDRSIANWAIKPTRSSLRAATGHLKASCSAPSK